MFSSVDEEDQIDDDLNKNGGAGETAGGDNARIIASRRRGPTLERGKEGQKLERLVKTGYSKKSEQLGFPNYFIAQKVRAKVSQTDETTGTKTILCNGSKEDKKTLVDTKAGVEP